MDLQIQSTVAGDQSQAALLRPRSALIDALHPRRKDVESFIAQRFLDVHGARIDRFMPQLLALFDDRDRVLASVGIRAASRQRLFLEYYLDNPVEQIIAARNGTASDRAEIVEIGNLASRDRRASRALFSILAQQLHTERFEWAVFTGCSALQRMFAELGIETLALGRALQSSLPRDQQTWGSYYEDRPQVLAGRVNRGCAVFFPTGMSG